MLFTVNEGVISVCLSLCLFLSSCFHSVRAYQDSISMALINYVTLKICIYIYSKHCSWSSSPNSRKGCFNSKPIYIQTWHSISFQTNIMSMWWKSWKCYSPFILRSQLRDPHSVKNYDHFQLKSIQSQLTYYWKWS